MASRTSGGLIKRSMTFDESQLREMERVAAERNSSTSAVMREMVDLGFRVYQRRKLVQSPVEDLVIENVAREEAV